MKIWYLLLIVFFFSRLFAQNILGHALIQWINKVRGLSWLCLNWKFPLKLSCLKVSRWIPFKLLIMAFMLIGSNALHAQTNVQESDIRDILESTAESLPEDYDMSELIDVMMKYRKHPVNLNHTSPEELKAFIFLSPLQISNFFAYIKENGQFVDVLELQSIEGFDAKTVQSLLPFVTLTNISEYEQLKFKHIIHNGENDLMLRFAQTLQKQRGFTDLPGNRYLGSPERFQARYRYNYSTILSAALTLDKDAGEKFGGKPFDFYSGNVDLGCWFSALLSCGFWIDLSPAQNI